MADILAADLVGDRSDAGRPRHRVPSEKQMIAGADQAGVEQHGIDGTEFSGLDAFRKQAAVEIQQRCDEEVRHVIGGIRTALVQQIMDQPIHIGKAVIGPDDPRDMQAEFRGRRNRLRQQIFEMRHLGRGVARQ